MSVEIQRSINAITSKVLTGNYTPYIDPNPCHEGDNRLLRGVNTCNKLASLSTQLPPRKPAKCQYTSKVHIHEIHRKVVKTNSNHKKKYSNF